MVPPQNDCPPQAPPPLVAIYMATHPAAVGTLPGFPNFLGPPVVPQQQQQRSQGRGGGRQCNSGRGCGMSRLAMAFGHQPPPTDVQPQQGYHDTGQGAANKHTYYINCNLNIYMTYGVDVSGWHTSKTCPVACYKPLHYKSCSRTNYLQYQETGWTASMKKSEKTTLPTNPGPHQM